MKLTKVNSFWLSINVLLLYKVLESCLSFHESSQYYLVKKTSTLSASNSDQEASPQDKLKALIPATPDKTIRAYLEDAMNIAAANRTAIGESIRTPNGGLCSPTSQLQVLEASSNVNGTLKKKIILQSLDDLGNPKSYGGDEFVIIYIDHGEQGDNVKPGSISPYTQMPTAVAIVTDNDNGTYDLDFVRPPMTEIHYLGVGGEALLKGTGTLYVTFDYTCGFGRMTKPTKDQWRRGSSLSFISNWFAENFTIPVALIRDYEVPPLINIAAFDSVICFGDSLIHNSCGMRAKEYRFQRPKLDPIPHHYGERLTHLSLVDGVIAELGQLKGSILNSTAKTALITGSAAWDIGANLKNNPHDFNDSLDKNRYFIRQLQNKFPNTTIIWRGPLAIHMGVLGEECFSYGKCTERFRYVSNSITRYLNKQQKAMAMELGISYVDCWELTYISVNWHMHRDGIHYRDWLNHLLIDQLYPEDMRFYST